MDSDSVFAGRLEVVTTGRRRRFSEAEKVRIVEESLRGFRQASATARRHGISRTLLFRWRKAYRDGCLGTGEGYSFTPAVVVPDRPSVTPTQTTGCGRMEVVLNNGRRVVVGPDVDAAALVRLVSALEQA